MKEINKSAKFEYTLTKEQWNALTPAERNLLEQLFYRAHDKTKAGV
jgi:hypothetical protein